MNKKIEEIFQPIGIDVFYRDYLGKQAVYMPGPESRTSHLMTKESFFELANNPKSDVFVGCVGNDKRFHQFTVENKRARSFFECGMSIQLEDLQILDDNLLSLGNLIREELQLYPAMEAAALMSPPAEGYPIHMDPNPDVWILQVTGSKKWSYSKKPAVSVPLSWATVTETAAWGGDTWAELRRPTDDDFVTHTLTPGDILYFPGGTWHTTSACEESLSVILSNVNSTWTEFFFKEFEAQLLERKEWRYIPSNRDSNIRSVLQERHKEFLDFVSNYDLDKLASRLEAARQTRAAGAYRQKE